MTALPNKTVTIDGKTFDLNGLPVTFKGNCPYKAVYYGKNFNEDYMAVVTLTKEEAKIAGKNKNTYLFHIGRYEDPRAAAYAAMMFSEDREANVLKLRDLVSPQDWECEIPEFKYEAIEGSTRVDKRGRKVVKAKSAKAAHVNAVKDKIAGRPATDMAPQIWGNTVFVDLAKKFGKETVLNARKYLNVNEFALRFGLALEDK